MPATTGTSRTAHLLALMKKRDDAFNARDFAAVDEVHHPDVIADATERAEPIYGNEAYAAFIQQQVLRSFPGRADNDPLPDPVRQRRLDHRGHPLHRNLHRGAHSARTAP